MNCFSYTMMYMCGARIARHYAPQGEERIAVAAAADDDDDVRGASCEGRLKRRNT
jgi:hypothetical protein